MRTTLTLALLLAVAPALRAADGDKVDNPPYKHWAAFKPGAMATVKTTIHDMTADDPSRVDKTAAPPGTHESTTHYTLKELTPEKAVVEVVTVDHEGGNLVEHAPVKITYPAKIEKKYATSVPKDKIAGFKEGMEDVKIGKATLKCQYAESAFKVEGEESTSKQWYSNAVPGGTVKSVTKKTQGGKVLYEAHVELIAFKVD